MEALSHVSSLNQKRMKLNEFLLLRLVNLYFSGTGCKFVTDQALNKKK